MTTASAKTLADFEHTVRVVTARIHAAESFAPSPITATFTISLLAAAGAARTQLPRGKILAAGSQLAVTIEPDGVDLLITLQLRGFQPLKQHAGKDGRLISADDRVDVPFHFDTRGTAVCRLTDSDIARAGLEHFRVEVFGAV